MGVIIIYDILSFYKNVFASLQIIFVKLCYRINNYTKILVRGKYCKS